MTSLVSGFFAVAAMQDLTLYHVNQPNYTGITNMDTGDAAGDAFFALRSRFIPLNCAGEALTNSSCQPAAYWSSSTGPLQNHHEPLE